MINKERNISQAFYFQAIQSAPIFPTDKLTCQQTIEDGVMKQSKCKEVTSIKPLGERINVIEFEGQMRLTLNRVESAENSRIRKYKILKFKRKTIPEINNIIKKRIKNN